MRSMSDPDYVYTPWSKERKETASKAAKRRLAARVQFSLRMNGPLRAKIEQAALEHGVTMNNEIIHRLLFSFNVQQREQDIRQITKIVRDEMKKGG